MDHPKVKEKKSPHPMWLVWGGIKLTQFQGKSLNEKGTVLFAKKSGTKITFWPKK